MLYAGGNLIALCDCNNFFVSCERLYDSSLKKRPVVVLSSNDGCVISRSDEVKAMGIAMGAPYYQVEGLLRKKGVAVRSGNLLLYSTVSKKVMQVLAKFTPSLEKYSIDEAFLDLSVATISDPVSYAREIRETVLRWVGVPVSIGIASSKTLAKLAGDAAKKCDGVLRITEGNLESFLNGTPVEDVWGIGRKTSKKLEGHGVRTAMDFVRRDPLWVKKLLSVRGLITQQELQGHPRMPLQLEEQIPKSIQVSRTYSEPLTEFRDVECAIIEHTLKAGKSLRRWNLATCAMSVFIRHGYRHHGECEYLTDDIYFNNPLMSDIELIACAREVLRRIFKEGRRITQGGVILCNFADSNFKQRELFDENNLFAIRAKFERLARATDKINEHLGKRAIFPASLAGKDGGKWRPARKMASAGEIRI
ncbi:Y-family DNA polymerase [Synergistaceae bacterium OttesenSCG-928-I11]|nr:Y-family DNA polymerase [Synergistaceae bacterium OttesenSCG-928-I11]